MGIEWYHQLSFNIYTFSQEEMNDGEDFWVPEKAPTSTYNLAKFRRVGLELVRCGISSRFGAAIINATILDLADIVPLPFNVQDIMVDKNKVDR